MYSFRFEAREKYKILELCLPLKSGDDFQIWFNFYLADLVNICAVDIMRCVRAHQSGTHKRDGHVEQKWQKIQRLHGYPVCKTTHRRTSTSCMLFVNLSHFSKIKVINISKFKSFHKISQISAHFPKNLPKSFLKFLTKFFHHLFKFLKIINNFFKFSKIFFRNFH